MIGGNVTVSLEIASRGERRAVGWKAAGSGMRAKSSACGRVSHSIVCHGQ